MVQVMEGLREVLKRLATTKQMHNPVLNDHSTQVTNDLKPVCEICGGHGWFTNDVPVSDAQFGKMVTCRCQQVKQQEDQTSRLLNYSNLRHLSRFKFDTLDTQGRSGEPEGKRLFAEAFQAALDYSSEPQGWLVFIGDHGSGKTHLAAAIANRTLEENRVVLFVNVADLLDHLRISFLPESEVSYSDLFNQVKNTPFLVLDGLEHKLSTTWAQEKLQQIINHRYSAELPTVITSSSKLSELDPYIRSRVEAEGLSRIIELYSRRSEPVHQLVQITPEMLHRMTFQKFNVRGSHSTYQSNKSLEYAFQAAKNFAADPDGWLTLFSENTGVGKTHLAVAIACERKRNGHPVFFAFVPELLDYLRYTFTPDSRITYDRVFDELKNTPLLILDDLGREHSSPWAEEKLYQIIVNRHNSRLPTIITSTLDFTKESGPISSRVQDPSIGDLIRIEAPDYRKKGRVSIKNKHR